MEKKTFMQKLKNMGPAAIITSAFIGPGTITTATLVGVKFQYALLWAVVFSGIASSSSWKCPPASPSLLTRMSSMQPSP